jgi:hypothetical protein
VTPVFDKSLTVFNKMQEEEVAEEDDFTSQDVTAEEESKQI